MWNFFYYLGVRWTTWYRRGGLFVRESTCPPLFPSGRLRCVAWPGARRISPRLGYGRERNVGTWKNTNVIMVPPLKNHPSKPIGFVYSPLWKITHQSPSVLCTPPLWKITHQKPSVLCTPPFEKSLFFVGAYFWVGVYFGKYAKLKIPQSTRST